jgi:flavin reductase (DIM6/NTAB) family NADH-FMN oxidoreductase RutF
MKRSFKEVNVDTFNENVFTLIGNDWMLITAGSPESFNTMTGGWGGFGVLWEKNVCYCFIRPPRLTYDYMEKAPSFTLSFFEEQFKNVLEYCGTFSGREVDKISATGLTPVAGNDDIVYFQEARLVFECRKIYFQDIMPAHFLDSSIARFYPEKDYHRMYVGEILRCLKK